MVRAVTGFAESGYEKTRAQLAVQEGFLKLRVKRYLSVEQCPPPRIRPSCKPSSIKVELTFPEASGFGDVWLHCGYPTRPIARSTVAGACGEPAMKRVRPDLVPA